MRSGTYNQGQPIGENVPSVHVWNVDSWLKLPCKQKTYPTAENARVLYCFAVNSDLSVDI